MILHTLSLKNHLAHICHSFVKFHINNTIQVIYLKTQLKTKLFQMEKNSIQSIFMKCTKLFILFLLLSLKGFSQQNPTVAKNPKFTLKYTSNEFCFRTMGESKPTVLNNKGEIIEAEILKSGNFSYVKISGQGNLIMDANGVVDHQKSDIGIYSVSLKLSTYTSSIIFNVKKCD